MNCNEKSALDIKFQEYLWPLEWFWSNFKMAYVGCFACYKHICTTQWNILKWHSPKIHIKVNDWLTSILERSSKLFLVKEHFFSQRLISFKHLFQMTFLENPPVTKGCFLLYLFCFILVLAWWVFGFWGFFVAVVAAVAVPEEKTPSSGQL